MGFPFLLGRAFIEAAARPTAHYRNAGFPFLLGRAFIEAWIPPVRRAAGTGISLPSRKGFH